MASLIRVAAATKSDRYSMNQIPIDRSRVRSSACSSVIRGRRALEETMLVGAILSKDAQRCTDQKRARIAIDLVCEVSNICYRYL